MALLFNSKLCEGKVERAAKMLKVIWFSVDCSSYHNYSGYIWKGILVSSRGLKLWPCPFVCIIDNEVEYLWWKWYDSQSKKFLLCEVKWKLLSRVWLFATPWTIQSVEFSRPETGVVSLSLLQGMVSTQISLIAGGFFTIWVTKGATCYMALYKNKVCCPLI